VPNVPPGGIVETDEQRAARVLAQRARALAAAVASPEEETLDVVAFETGPERYAIALDLVLRVERVERAGAVARVPGAGPDVIGVLSIDGRPCPLVDAPALLGATAAATPRRWAIVLGRRTPEVAIAADAVDLLRIPRADLAGADSPRLGTTRDARVVLDGAALVGDPAHSRLGGDVR
jgi:chemotaxis signal transduction protein